MMITAATESTTETEAVVEIMDRVRRWSGPARIALARRILESLEAPAAAAVEPVPVSPASRPVRGVPVEAVAGRFRGGNLPPTDEECRQILEEELWKKYGS